MPLSIGKYEALSFLPHSLSLSLVMVLFYFLVRVVLSKEKLEF